MNPDRKRNQHQLIGEGLNNRFIGIELAAVLFADDLDFFFCDPFGSDELVLGVHAFFQGNDQSFHHLFV